MIWPKWDGGGFPEMSLGTSKWCEEQVVAISWSASHTSSRYHGNPWKGSLSTSISVLKSVLSCWNFHPLQGDEAPANDRMPVPSSLPLGRWWCWAQTMSISVGTQCRGRGDMEMRKNETRWAKSGWQITVPAGCQMHDLYWFYIDFDLWIFMVNCSWISMILMVWTWLLSGMLRSDLSIALVILESAWSERGFLQTDCQST